MKRYIYALMSLFFAVSCSSDPDFGTDPETGKNYLTFTLENQGTRALKTRATRAEIIGDDSWNENTIERLDIFFYDITKQKCLFYPVFDPGDGTGNATWDPLTKKVTIVFDNKEADLIIGKQVVVYLMANCDPAILDRGAILWNETEQEGMTLADLQQITYEAAELNPAPNAQREVGPQENFLMDGEISVYASGGSNLGNIVLRRAAAKVTVAISNAGILGYTAVSARVSLRNYLNKTHIGAGAGTYDATVAEYEESEGRELWLSSQGGTAYDTPPFYSFANDWSEKPKQESYLQIEVDWLKNGESQPLTYYYRIPFNYIQSGEGNANEHKFQLKRNYIYRFLVDISALGGLDPDEAVNLEANFDVFEWSTNELDVSITKFNWLFIYEQNVSLYNTTSYQIRYSSSLPLQYMPTSETYAYYIRFVDDASKDYKETVYYDISTISITYDPYDEPSADGNTYIYINSPLPTNYGPKYMMFKFQNSAQLFNRVYVTQYPALYVTTTKSTGGIGVGSNTTSLVPNKNLDYGYGVFGGNTYENGNFYQVHITTFDPVIMGNSRVGDPIARDAYGNYQFDENGKIATDASASAVNIVSPRFVVASNRGVPPKATVSQPTMTYANAVARCKSYWEGPYPEGTWRLPTEAEMRLIYNLQNEESVINGLFNSYLLARRWWLANSRVVDWDASDSESAITNSLNTPFVGHVHGVTCIHDLWMTTKPTP